ncbi:hypothetical protein HanRHA438_Chr15g0730801 [Helianthus annuus]|nr:hypothetical protein HanRHA438_Chr15g0730801 [Helianthus annuus]
MKEVEDGGGAPPPPQQFKLGVRLRRASLVAVFLVGLLITPHLPSPPVVERGVHHT